LFFEPKKLTAIVGTVGSGKSTLLQMLMGELPPTEGTVELAVHLKHLATQKSSFFKLNLYTEKGLKILRNNQSFVPQEAFIFSATIRENVPLSYAWAEGFSYDDKEIVNALHAASLEEDLKEFSHHIDTEIGERGVNLSGGQKQRLSLARALFANRSVVFLDDPFSAVDVHTEEKLAQSLFKEEFLNEKTIIWVTHRMTHIHLAHQVVRLEKGRVFVEKSS
jgi:ABC-type multidrug transport system fused ATPase/permease subunit